MGGSRKEDGEEGDSLALMQNAGVAPVTFTSEGGNLSKRQDRGGIMAACEADETWNAPRRLRLFALFRTGGEIDLEA